MLWQARFFESRNEGYAKKAAPALHHLARKLDTWSLNLPYDLDIIATVSFGLTVPQYCYDSLSGLLVHEKLFHGRSRKSNRVSFAYYLTFQALRMRRISS
jgi:hypothetical protein